MTLKAFISRLKWINGLGFLICLSSFVFWYGINQFFINLSFVYQPDNGQYIVMYIGLLLGFYGINEPVVKLFAGLFSFNLFDEITGDNGLVNLNDYFDIFLIFVLAIYNYKNVKNGTEIN
jgi:hypothetical protein